MSGASSPAGYAIGIDFGTESGRVLLVDLVSGEESAAVVVPYASGVIDSQLPGSGERLPPEWSLQDPRDWMQVILTGVPRALSESGVEPAAVVGFGIDFTSCTVLPVDRDGTPMCEDPGWREHRHAWPKLWRHHSAHHVAERLTAVAAERDEPFLARYGGRISSEWLFPKLIELWLEDRELYDASAEFCEASDWIVRWLTGVPVRGACAAGYKAFWSAAEGFPGDDYFEAAYPGFSRPTEKLASQYLPLGAPAGTIRPELAERIGLAATTAVAVGNVDSFATVPGAGVEDPGTFVIAIGTSICDMVVHPQEIRLPGITGVVADGILPGQYGYEAGQAAVGDMLAWYVRLLDDEDRSHAALEQRAALIAPGGTGLVALDWWNGNRSILADAELAGTILGLTVHTTDAEIYRALLEAIAFGSRRIMDNFEQHGIPLTRIVACGGIANKSPLMMQLLADTSGREVTVPKTSEAPARGAALFGAVAGGAFASIAEAVSATRSDAARVYRPDPAASAVYERSYAIYRELYELLGSTRSDWLHSLRRIKAAA